MSGLTSLKAICFAVLTLVVIAPDRAIAQSVLNIQNDGGGVVKEYIIKANLAVLRGDRIRIDGWCASACTAYLGNANTCITPNASFGFHGPSGGSPAENRRVAQTLARHLPPVLQSWYLTTAAQLQGRDHIIISARDMVRFGAARWC